MSKQLAAAAQNTKAKNNTPVEIRNMSWTKDGKNGPVDPVTLESIVYDWLEVPGNYEKFRNGHGGKTKTHYCAIISENIKKAG